MATILPQAQAPAIATSMMGSLYGVVRTWDDSFSLTDMFGYSGHAFILNIERTLCPSGPTAWDWGAILFPLRQIFSLRRICATCDMRSSEEARELIWQRTIESIDAGRPAMLWDALIPEFYLACGYDLDTAEFIVQGPLADRVSGRVSMSKLGSRSGQVWALFPAPNDERDTYAARDLALRGATTWHRWPNERDAQWTFGGEAWNVWIAALTEEELAHDSAAVSLNHQVYAECRRHAADFLKGQGTEFAEAAEAYAKVADELQSVCNGWPYLAPVPSLDVRRQLAEHIAAARDAETEGVQALKIVLAQGKTANV